MVNQFPPLPPSNAKPYSPYWQAILDSIDSIKLDKVEAIGTYAARNYLPLTTQEAGIPIDGVTDATTALRAAFARAASENRPLQLSGGVALVSPSGTGAHPEAALEIPDGLRLEVFPGFSLKMKAGVTGTALRGQDTQNFTVAGPLLIDMNKANTPDSGDINAQIGVYLVAGTAAGIKNVDLGKISVINSWGCGIRVYNPDATANPAEVTIGTGTTSGCRIGVFTTGTTRLVMLGHRALSNTTDGIYVTAGKSDVVQGCQALLNGRHGIVFDGAATAFSATGNITNDNGGAGTVGCGIVVSVGCNRFTVDDNICLRNRGSNIQIDPLDGAAPTVQIDAHSSVCGNVANDAATFHGIYINFARYMTVVGNTANGNAAMGIQLSCSNATVGPNTTCNNGSYGVGNQWAIATPLMGGHVITLGASVGNVLGDYQEDTRTTRDNPTTRVGKQVENALGSIVTGQETYSRWLLNSQSIACATGVLKLTFFPANKTQTVTKATVETGTAAAATPTISRLGLYERDPVTGTITLVASTPNDTALFTTGFSTRTKSFSASAVMTAGKSYALGVLNVTAAAAPTFGGCLANIQGVTMARPPMLAGQVTGQADLPSTVAAGSIVSSAGAILGVVEP